VKTEEFQNTFPGSIPIPDALAQLCAWHDANGYPISGYFKLRGDTYEAIRHWFGTSAVVDRFGVFALARMARYLPSGVRTTGDSLSFI